jgi:glycosyltransferase involved in cell wall biosynthesis
VPKVSVLIITRNRRALLTSCIASVIDQSFTDFEIVLVNDGSTEDMTPLIPRVHRYVSTPPCGVGHARNVAIEASCGDYLYTLDSDDLLAPDALHVSVEVLEATGADMVFSDLMLLVGNEVVGYFGASEQTLPEVLRAKKIPHGSTMLRRSTLDVRYDEDLESAEDLDFLLRYMPGKTIKMIPKAVYFYRIHPDQGTLSTIQMKTATYIRKRYRRLSGGRDGLSRS